MSKNCKPTPEMIQAAELVFVAMAAVDLIKPIVRGYQAKILAEKQWPIKEQYAGRLGKEIILDPEHSYLLEETTMTEYFALCNEARKQANLHVDSEDKCPLCVAEYQLVQAKWCLCEVMAPVTKIAAEKITAASMENYKSYIELTLKLLGSYVRPAAKLMDEFGFNANGQKLPAAAAQQPTKGD